MLPWIVTACAVVAAALAWQGRAPAGGDPALEARVAALEHALEEERAAHDALEATVAGLTADFFVESAPTPVAVATPSTRPAGEAARPPDRTRARDRGAGPAGRFDPGVLVDAGFARRDAEAYAALLDETELERLALRDRATREGWLRTPRYAEEARDLSARLDEARAAYGDDFADWALYSAGQPNRLRVADVIEGSPAAEAGLRSGDVVQRYADAKVLSVSELRELTTSGDAGDSTAVDVRRGDETLRLFLPRGPLGVRLDPITEEPDTPR